jgi:hypothetical protein
MSCWYTLSFLRMANLDWEVSPYLPSNNFAFRYCEVDVIYCPVWWQIYYSLPMVFDQPIAHTNPPNLTPGPSSHGENHPQNRGIACGYQLLLPRVLSSKDTSSTFPEVKGISHILTACIGLLQPPKSPCAHGTGSSSAIRERHVGSWRLNSNKVTRAC